MKSGFSGNLSVSCCRAGHKNLIFGGFRKRTENIYVSLVKKLLDVINWETTKGNKNKLKWVKKIESDIYLCWRKLSWRLKYFPQISQENVTSGLLWVRSCIIKLYGLVKRRWQNLHTNSHFGRILRRKSDRRSSLSIRITANIFADFGLLLFFAWRDSLSVLLRLFPRRPEH